MVELGDELLEYNKETGWTVSKNKIQYGKVYAKVNCRNCGRRCLFTVEDSLKYSVNLPDPCSVCKKRNRK